MIDKADIRVPWNCPFTQGFKRILDHAEWNKTGVWKQSQLYERMGNFEAFGLELVLHQGCRAPNQPPNHKLEILKTGQKTISEMECIVREVFDADPKEMGMMRVDLTADVEDVPVQWFRDHTVVTHKRIKREMGSIPPESYQIVGKGIAQTLYAGKKPNQTRIYNKTGERLEQLARHHQKIGIANKKAFLEGPGAVSMMKPTFEQIYGYSPTKIITRVENQIGGKTALERAGLSRFEDLKRTPWMEPFKKIRFVHDAAQEPKREHYGDDAWWAGLYWRREAREHGIDAVRSQLYAEIGNKNFYRKWKDIEPFLRGSVKLCTYEKLTKEYQSSCHRQLFAA